MASTNSTAGKVVKKYNWALDYRKDRKDMWFRHNDLYHSRPKKKKSRNLSNTFIPVTNWVVETICSALVRAFFQNRPYYTVLGTTPLGQIHKEEVEQHLDWVLPRLNFSSICGKIFRNTLIYSKGYMKVTWRNVQRETVSREPYKIFGMTLPFIRNAKKEKFTEFNNLWVESKSPLHMYIDPDAQTLHGQGRASWAVERIITDLETLKWENHTNPGKKPKYANLDKITKGFDPEFQDGSESEKAFFDPKAHSPQSLRTNTPVEILELWDVEGKHIMIANREVPIKEEENIFWDKKIPYFDCTLIEQENSYYGMSIIEIIEYLQLDINHVFNGFMNNVNFILNAGGKIRKGANIPDEQLVNEPGNFKEVTDLDRDLAWDRPPDMTASILLAYNILEKILEQSTAITAYQQGVLPSYRGGDIKATEASLASQGSNSRVAHHLQVIEDQMLRPAFSMFMSRFRQFIQDSLTITTANPFSPFLTIHPDVFDLHFEGMVAGGNLSASKEYRLTKELQLYNLTANDPILNPMKPREMILKAFGEKDIKGWFSRNGQGEQPETDEFGNPIATPVQGNKTVVDRTLNRDLETTIFRP